MADTMTPQEHYAAGMEELDDAPDKDATYEGRKVRAARAQAHFQGGLLAAVLEDQEKQQEPGWEAEEALREHRAQNPASGASPDGP